MLNQHTYGSILEPGTNLLTYEQNIESAVKAPPPPPFLPTNLCLIQ